MTRETQTILYLIEKNNITLSELVSINKKVAEAMQRKII